MSQSFADTGSASFLSFTTVAPDGSYRVTEKLFQRMQFDLMPCGCCVARPHGKSVVCPVHPQLSLQFVTGGDAE